MRFLALALAATLTCAAEPLDTILARMDSSAKTANSFASKLKWSEYTKSIDDLYEQTGSIALHRVKGRVMGRLDVEKPNQFTWHFMGDTWEKFLPKANMVEVYQVTKLSKSSDQYLLLVFGATGVDLRKTYDMKGGAEESIAGTKATHLELIPKDKKAREYAAKVELWVPVGQSYAVQQKVTEPNGDYNLWTYTDAKVNPTVPESSFEFTAPAGAQKRVMNK